MSKRIIISEDELPIKFLQACKILSKVRNYRKRFEETHDGQVKTTMKQWEARADEFLAALQTEEDDQQP